jgi:hypothetical protein
MNSFHRKLNSLLVLDLGLELLYKVFQVPNLLLMVLFKDGCLSAMSGTKLFMLSSDESVLLLKFEFPRL